MFYGNCHLQVSETGNWLDTHGIWFLSTFYEEDGYVFISEGKVTCRLQQKNQQLRDLKRMSDSRAHIRINYVLLVRRTPTPFFGSLCKDDLLRFHNLFQGLSHEVEMGYRGYSMPGQCTTW